MFMQKITLSLAIFLMATGAATSIAAQDKKEIKSSIDRTENQTSRTNRIKRKVQPISYWVDAESLRVRDNPVAGNIVKTLENGNKIVAYTQYENWIRISKSEDKQQWVNSDFLSNSPISWASFSRNVRTPSSDVIAVRIKDPEDKKSRIHAVRLKKSDTGNAVVTTREATSQGIFYQNRFVSCDDQRAVGSRLIGEGRSFLTAQNDFRNYALDIYGAEQINDKASNGIEQAISSFACKTKTF